MIYVSEKKKGKWKEKKDFQVWLECSLGTLRIIWVGWKLCIYFIQMLCTCFIQMLDNIYSSHCSFGAKHLQISRSSILVGLLAYIRGIGEWKKKLQFNPWDWKRELLRGLVLASACIGGESSTSHSSCPPHEQMCSPLMTKVNLSSISKLSFKVKYRKTNSNNEMISCLKGDSEEGEEKTSIQKGQVWIQAHVLKNFFRGKKRKAILVYI